MQSRDIFLSLALLLPATIRSTTQPVKPWFKQSQFAWGNEKININHLDVADKYQNQKLIVLTDGNNNYQLFSPKYGFILTGIVGQPATTAPTQADPVSIQISSLIGNPVRRPIYHYQNTRQRGCRSIGKKSEHY